MAEFPRTVAVFSGGGTGGHLYPALALAEALEAVRPDVAPVFVGAERGIEARILPERGLEHLLLPVRGLSRTNPVANLGVLRALGGSLSRVREAFRRWRPALVVVTGGYAGGPAGIAARTMGIPLALQEQNAEPGLTTRLLSRWAMQIHVAFPEARERLPRSARERVRISGNPVRTPRPVARDEARRRLGVPEEGTLVLVVGGSQGSAALNRLVLEGVRGVGDGRLLRPLGLRVLWSTGPAHLAAVTTALEGMGSPEWVHPVGYLDDMPSALAAADLAVSRAGAMATSEFLAWGLPSVLVPLPSAAADHQSRNAEALAAAGAALHLAQAGLEPQALWTAVARLAADPDRRAAMSRAARERGRPGAAREIADALASLLPPAGRAA